MNDPTGRPFQREPMRITRCSNPFLGIFPRRYALSGLDLPIVSNFATQPQPGWGVSFSILLQVSDGVLHLRTARALARENEPSFLQKYGTNCHLHFSALCLCPSNVEQALLHSDPKDPLGHAAKRRPAPHGVGQVPWRPSIVRPRMHGKRGSSGRTFGPWFRRAPNG